MLLLTEHPLWESPAFHQKAAKKVYLCIRQLVVGSSGLWCCELGGGEAVVAGHSCTTFTLTDSG